MQCVAMCCSVYYGVAAINRLLKLQVYFAKEHYKRDYILQKRPTILRSLLIVATPYLDLQSPLWCPLANTKSRAGRLTALQCVAVCCSVLQVCCKCVAECCRVMPCATVCCGVFYFYLQSAQWYPLANSKSMAGRLNVLQCVAWCCVVLQCVAVRFRVLQSVLSLSTVCTTSTVIPSRLFFDLVITYMGWLSLVGSFKL